MNTDDVIAHKLAWNKIIFYAFTAFIMAIISNQLPVLFNRSTEAIEQLSYYQFILYTIVAFFFLIQLIPGFSRLIITKEYIEEYWFFRRRYRFFFKDIFYDHQPQVNQGLLAASLYIHRNNAGLLSTRKLIKGIYKLTDQQIYSQFAHRLEKNKNHARFRLYFKSFATLFIAIFMLLYFFIHAYYLQVNSIDQDFREQVVYWQNQGLNEQQLFDRLKIYGFFWKEQIRQFDYRLYKKLIRHEAKLIESRLIKKIPREKQQNAMDKINFCRERYLLSQHHYYFVCLSEIYR